jgi:hypothetical protein
MTAPGWGVYQLVLDTPLVDLWVEQHDARFLLQAVPRDEIVRYPDMQAFPTCYSYDGEQLLLYPIPNASYRIGWGVATVVGLRHAYERMERDLRESLYGGRHLGNSVNYQKAADKSKELLRSWLSPEQLEQFDRDGEFTVVGSSTGKKYLITSGAQPYNVIDLDKWPQIAKIKLSQRYCFVPSNGAKAPGDVMLAQKIALETDETAALAVANRPLELTDMTDAFAGLARPGLTWTNDDETFPQI